MTRDEIVQVGVNLIMAHHDQVTFSQLLCLLRKNLKLTRTIVSDETEISEHRLMNLETGKRLKNARLHEIGVLANYYNIDFSILLDKAIEIFPNLKVKK